jgi:hypothetical protein
VAPHFQANKTLLCPFCVILIFVTELLLLLPSI